MLKTVALCFAKTPGLTPAKTRLARDIGDECCLILYKLMVNRCRELMQELEEFCPHVAVNEKEGLSSPFWQGLSTYEQSPGPLGEKLAHAENYFCQNFDQILFWGTDSPGLTAQHFFSVREALTKTKAAVIPALDGGFALYGSRGKLESGSWTDIHYSTSSTCRELLSFIGPSVTLTQAISDLDRIDDLPAVLREMEALPSQGPAWDELKDFLKKL